MNVLSLLEQLPARRRTPLSTYRLQMHRQFGFQDASSVLTYLERLGVSDCYTSSIFKARPGSLHGYDITDHNALNPELGTEVDYENFANDLRRRGMGHLLDFVPNHMGIDPENNPWWRDVLENGPSSRFASYFDINWSSIKPELKDKVLLPILGDQYGAVLERGELQLVFENGLLVLRYGDHHLPINPRGIPEVLKWNLDALTKQMGDSADLSEYRSILTELSNLPPITERAADRIEERQREKDVAQKRLMTLTQKSPRLSQHILEAVAAFNGKPEEPASFDPLHRLLEAQAYRLAYWKTASHEVNYRRFFDINDLAGLRVEQPEVFAATHRLVLRYIGEGKIMGLRLDHIDGLYDPAGYEERLQDSFLQEWIKEQWKRNGQEENQLPPDWLETLRNWRVAERKKDPTGLAARPLYLAAEKILCLGEALDPHWMIDGTSGYDYLNDLNGLFIDSEKALPFKEIYTRFTGKNIPPPLIPYICKKLIMSRSMASELNVLAHKLNQISEAERRRRDFTLISLLDALREVIAFFPVYRTYINESRCSAWDRETIEQAIHRAKRRNPIMEPSIFDFIQEVLIPSNAEKVPMTEFKHQLQFAMSFQQYTGPVEAKGLEDTAFYRYNALLSLNEVGGDPARFGCPPAAFHEANVRRQKEWPFAMLASATHDTKRGEDARARLNVLSEIPEEWDLHVSQWADLNAVYRASVDQAWAPDRNEEYMYYQALLGAWSADPEAELWPSLADRMSTYMIKAIKEARLHTSWTNPNQAYEKAVTDFVEKTLLGEGADSFRAAFVPFARRVAHAGMINSLAQVALKIASPGVPDFYQGTELWDLNLVDPDNRRPVDFERRSRLLDELEPYRKPVSGSELIGRQTSLKELLDQWPDGRIKLLLTTLGLHFRKSHPDLFLKGIYTPLSVHGERAGHVVAFAREFGDSRIIVVVPRLLAEMKLNQTYWETTYVKLPGSWGPVFRHVFTFETIQTRLSELPLSEVFRTLPIAWLTDLSSSC